ncbi:MAG: PorV/PorQ family protein, partial [Cyclobacteriaceae bacterium]
MSVRKTSLLIVLVALSTVTFSQNSTNGQNGNIITTAMSFLTIPADAKGAAMGDLGAATTPDANAAYWNPGKMVFNKNNAGAAISFTPWLRQLGITDMWIAYLSGYIKPKDDDQQAFGFHLNYFSLGDIQFTDELGKSNGVGKPKELSVGVTYSRKLSEKLGLGIGVNFLRSDLANGLASSGNNQNLKPANTLAADLGLYYKNEIYLGGRVFDMSLGGVISNLGGKVTYSTDD